MDFRELVLTHSLAQDAFCNEVISRRAPHAVLHLGWTERGLGFQPVLSHTVALLWNPSLSQSPQIILVPPAYLELKDGVRPRSEASSFKQLLQPAIAPPVFISQPQGCLFLFPHLRQAQSVQCSTPNVKTVVNAHHKPSVCFKSKKPTSRDHAVML